MEDRKKHCPHCGTALPEDASFCPHCESVLIEKHPAAVPKPKRRRRITAAILLAAVLAAALTAVGFASRGRVIDAQGAELFYDAEGEKFRLVLCFEAQGGAPFFSQPEIVENAREDQLHGRAHRRAAECRKVGFSGLRVPRQREGRGKCGRVRCRPHTDCHGGKLKRKRDAAASLFLQRVCSQHIVFPRTNGYAEQE